MIKNGANNGAKKSIFVTIFCFVFTKRKVLLMHT